MTVVVFGADHLDSEQIRPALSEFGYRFRRAKENLESSRAELAAVIQRAAELGLSSREISQLSGSVISSVTVLKYSKGKA